MLLVLLPDYYLIRPSTICQKHPTRNPHAEIRFGSYFPKDFNLEDYLQTEWPELKVWLTSTTEQWAVIALNGPNARKLIEPLVEGIDLSNEAYKLGVNYVVYALTH